MEKKYISPEYKLNITSSDIIMVSQIEEGTDEEGNKKVTVIVGVQDIFGVN